MKEFKEGDVVSVEEAIEVIKSGGAVKAVSISLLTTDPVFNQGPNGLSCSDFVCNYDDLYEVEDALGDITWLVVIQPSTNSDDLVTYCVTFKELNEWQVEVEAASSDEAARLVLAGEGERVDKCPIDRDIISVKCHQF